MTQPFRTSADQLLVALINDPVDTGCLEQLLAQGIDWDWFHLQAARHELLPLVYRGLKQVAAYLPPDVLAHYQNGYAANTLRNLQLHKELHGLLQELSRARIPVISYKGPVLAESAYGDLALRMFRDLDLLVPVEQVRQAIELLEGLGYRLEVKWPEERWPSLLKTVNHLLLRHQEKGWAVEVHWLVFHPMYALPFDLEPYWADLRGRESEGKTTLTHEDQLLLICAHGTKHHWELMKWIVDVRQLVNSLADLDWEGLWDGATRNGMRRCLLLALELAGRVGDYGLPLSMQQRVKADPVVGELADSAWEALFRRPTGRRRFLWECHFYLRSRERFRDRIKQVGRWLLYPRLEDWLAFPAGDRCFLLFVLGRPLRVGWKRLVRPVLCKVGCARPEL